MRLTSRFPSGRNSWVTCELLRQHLNFIVWINAHTRLVFADKKSTKEIAIFGTIRRNPFLGSTPNHEIEANSKNRYSILAVVTLKIVNEDPVEYTILEDKTKSFIFYSLYVYF